MKLWIITGLLSLGLAPAAIGQETRTPPPGPPPGDMLQAMDVDGDGAVTASEFQAFNDKRFDELDSDDDGKITKAEMKKRSHHRGEGRGRLDEDATEDQDTE